MERRHILLGLAGAAAPFLIRRTAALGQTPSQDGGVPFDPSSYAEQTLQIGTLAKTTSQIALRNSQSRFVRRFAQLEIAEQTAVAQSLTSNFDPPPVPLTPDQHQIVQSLQALLGSDFDAAYVKVQIQGHRQLLAIQKKFLAANTDPGSNFVHIALIATASIETHLAILRGLLSIDPSEE